MAWCLETLILSIFAIENSVLAATISLECAPGEIQRSNFFFDCVNRRYVPTGCRLSSTGQRLAIGARAVSDRFEYQCRVNGEEIQLAITACISKSGKRLEPNSNDNDVEDNFVLACRKYGDRVGAEYIECVTNDGQRVQLGQVVEGSDGFRYTCRRDNNKLRLRKL